MARPDANARVYCVYLITNMVNGKQYAGKTYLTAVRRFGQHKSEARAGAERYVCRALRKYGEGNFAVCCLRDGLTRQQASEEEKLVIRTLQLDDCEFGYNLTKGGDGVIPNDETVEKMKNNSGTRRRDIDDDKLVDLYVKGMSRIEIAKIFNCGHSTVRRHLEWRGIKIRSQQEWRSLKTPEFWSSTYNKYPDLNDKVIEILYLEGWTQQEIADQFGVSLTTVFRRLQKLGTAKRANGTPGARDRKFEDPSERDAYIRKLFEDEEGRGRQIRRPLSAA